jgi:seryl-tRNA synthetase
MYDIKWIREHPDAFDRGLKRRGLEPLSQHLISIDERRRATIRVLESFQADRNAASKQIGEAKRSKDESKVTELTVKVAKAKESIPRLEREQKEVEEELKKALSEIPNLPLDEVPDGKDANDNVEYVKSEREQREIPLRHRFSFKPKQHFELGEALGQMDFELAAKLSGARFVVLQKGLARLERALGQFMLDVHTSKEHGYTEVSPPILVRDEAMFGTAQLPKFKEDQFPTTFHRVDITDAANRIADKYSATFESVTQEFARQVLDRLRSGALGWNDPLFKNDVDRAKFATFVWTETHEIWNQIKGDRVDLWLIPTAEVPLTNLVRESIIDEDKLPMRLTACTPCFRAEAGAAGKDTRGMIRQHQFTKVELVSITTPEKSREEHERMLACAEEVLKKLGLHYRVVTLCTGDMGFAAQKTYDIEVWLPGQNAYREISSCSNCGEFQARRMDARYRAKGGVRHVHTLNGSGVAVGRALIAVMETYQQENGSIAVPSALAPYMGRLTKIERA